MDLDLDPDVDPGPGLGDLAAGLGGDGGEGEAALAAAGPSPLGGGAAEGPCGDRAAEFVDSGLLTDEGDVSLPSSDGDRAGSDGEAEMYFDEEEDLQQQAAEATMPVDEEGAALAAAVLFAGASGSEEGDGDSDDDDDDDVPLAVRIQRDQASRRQSAVSAAASEPAELERSGAASSSASSPGGSVSLPGSARASPTSSGTAPSPQRAQSSTLPHAGDDSDSDLEIEGGPEEGEQQPPPAAAPAAAKGRPAAGGPLKTPLEADTGGSPGAVAGAKRLRTEKTPAGATAAGSGGAAAGRDTDDVPRKKPRVSPVVGAPAPAALAAAAYRHGGTSELDASGNLPVRVAEVADGLGGVAAKLARHAPKPPAGAPPPVFRPAQSFTAPQQRRPAAPTTAAAAAAARATDAARLRLAAGGGALLATSHPVAAAMTGSAPPAPRPVGGASTSSSSIGAPAAPAQFRGPSGSSAALMGRLQAGAGAAAASLRIPGATPAAAGAARAKPAGGAGAAQGGKPRGLAAASGVSDLDLTSAALRASLAQRSLYGEQGAHELVGRVLERSGKMEAVEALEGRMADVTRREATRWFCLDCEKWFAKPPPACAADGHAVHSKKKAEWRFQCVGCGHRSYHGASLCAKPCSKCGKAAWRPCSIFAFKEGSDTLGSRAQLHTHGEGVTESLRTMGAHEF